MHDKSEKERPDAIIDTIEPLLGATVAIVQAEVGALTPAQARWHKDPTSWCVNEVVGHLIEAEQHGFAGRILTMLASNNPEFVTWDQPAVAAERGDCERDSWELAKEFVDMRTQNLQLVAELQPNDLGRTGRHPSIGVLTVRDVLVEWAYHDRDHVRQLLDVVQALVWSEMGNAQKFYDSHA